MPVPNPGRLTDVPPSYTIPGLPLIPQKDKYCGPAALATVLQHHGQPVSQDEAAAMVFTPGRDGTLQPDMIAALRRRGLLPLPVRTPDDMVRAAASGHPVIAFQNVGLSWVPAWHYAVIAGYDLPAGVFIVHGGTPEARRVSFRRLGATWARAGSWAYAAWTPDRLPGFLPPDDIVEAIAALESVGQWEAAAAAYRALLDHHPDMAAGWFGLGNIHLARDAVGEAADAYRRALAIDPGYAPAANNLAYALARQGRGDEACALLRDHAVNPGPYRDLLRDSLVDLCVTRPGSRA